MTGLTVDTVATDTDANTGITNTDPTGNTDTGTGG